jgi:hypothetical protein
MYLKRNVQVLNSMVDMIKVAQFYLCLGHLYLLSLKMANF